VLQCLEHPPAATPTVNEKIQRGRKALAGVLIPAVVAITLAPPTSTTRLVVSKLMRFLPGTSLR
jgi:hypothetical protein